MNVTSNIEGTLPILHTPFDANDEIGRACMFAGSGGILLIDAFRRGVIGTLPGIDLRVSIAALWGTLMNNDDATAYRMYFPICALVAL